MAKLSDDEAREIGEGIARGIRGPILLTWIRRLLRDRAERISDGIERAKAERRLKSPRARSVDRAPNQGPTIDYSVTQAIGVYWFHEYKTVLPSADVERELGCMSGESPSRLCAAFKNYVQRTPAKSFSWSAFRDSCKGWLTNGAPPNCKECGAKVDYGNLPFCSKHAGQCIFCPSRSFRGSVCELHRAIGF